VYLATAGGVIVGVQTGLSFWETVVAALLAIIVAHVAKIVWVRWQPAIWPVFRVRIRTGGYDDGVRLRPVEETTAERMLSAGGASVESERGRPIRFVVTLVAARDKPRWFYLHFQDRESFATGWVKVSVDPGLPHGA
jgi:hypothetical protein